MRATYIFLVIILCFFSQTTDANAQFLKKLKQKAEEKLLKKADEQVDAVFEGTDPQPEKPNKDNVPSTGKESSQQKQSTPKKQTSPSPDISEFMVLPSPNPAFKDIVLQKHKDLPRFGAIDFYMMRDNPKKVDLSKEAAEKRNLTGLGYTGFAHLARIHILKDHFKVMDRTALTQRTKGTIVEEEAKSSLAQKTLLEFAFSMGTDALKKEYFMNDWSGDGKSPFVRKWGGHQSDDFTENERYVSFVEKYLDIILKWSEDFFADGTHDFQLVYAVKFQGQYDFDHGGFWLRLPIKRPPLGVSALEYFNTFSPETTYGNQFYGKTEQVDHINAEVLFKISPEKAEALINDKSVLLQLTMKVKSVFKDFDTANPFVYSPNFTYHFLDPVMELYTNAQLTRKLGEIRLDQLIYKEPQ
jgi:hypothetical protein